MKTFLKWHIHWIWKVLYLICFLRTVQSNVLPASWQGVPDSQLAAASSITPNGSESNWSLPLNGSIEEEEEEEAPERYKVAEVDFAYVNPYLIIALWVLFASIAKIAFHNFKKLEHLVPESCLLIVVGVIVGVVIYFTVKDHNYYLAPQTFFLILLPPIILDAGYYMPSRSFFDNLGTILLYAVIGTLLNTLWIGFTIWGIGLTDFFALDPIELELLPCLVFASLLAAVDPVAVLAVFESIHVNEILHIVVFGESLLNDGVSVVLYHMFKGLNEIGLHNIIAVDVVCGIASFFVIVFGAVGIGFACGLFAGFLSRFTRHSRIMEPLLVAVIGYMSFLLAEMFHLSGILSCTFCGITMRKYVEVNMHEKSKVAVKYLLKMLASTSDTVVFTYLGISAVSDSHIWNTQFILLTLAFCLVYRTIGVILQTFLANRVRLVRLNKIDQFIMAYGGLRGAIAFALVTLLDEEHFPHKRLFETTTIVVIFFTNLVMGTTIKPLVTYLKVKLEDKRELTITEKITYRLMDHLMAGVEDLSGQKGHHLMRERFSHFNNKYLKPVVVGKKNLSQKRGHDIINVFNRLNKKDAIEMVKNPASATSVTRMQTHIKRLSSMPDFDPTRNYSVYDLYGWCYPMDGMNGMNGTIQTGSSPMISSPHGHPNNGVYKVNGGYNIDKDLGRSARRPETTAAAAAAAAAVDQSFDLPHHQSIYKRHMLSSTSLPKLYYSTKGGNDDLSSPTDGAETTPTNYESPSDDHRAITFRAPSDRSLHDESNRTSSTSDKSKGRKGVANGDIEMTNQRQASHDNEPGFINTAYDYSGDGDGSDGSESPDDVFDSGSNRTAATTTAAAAAQSQKGTSKKQTSGDDRSNVYGVEDNNRNYIYRDKTNQTTDTIKEEEEEEGDIESAQF